jgi:hypothetical protein
MGEQGFKPEGVVPTGPEPDLDERTRRFREAAANFREQGMFVRPRFPRNRRDTSGGADDATYMPGYDSGDNGFHPHDFTD